MIQCVVCQNNAIICQQAHWLITQWHKFPLTTPHPHTMGSLSISLPLPPLTPTQWRKDGVKRDTVIRGIAYLFLPVLPASLPYLNTQLDPCLYFSFFFFLLLLSPMAARERFSLLFILPPPASNCGYLPLQTVSHSLWTLPPLSHFYTVPLSVFFFSLFLFLFSFLGVFLLTDT